MVFCSDYSHSILIPACADACKTYTSPMTKEPVLMVAGGGVNDGRSLAAAIMLGAGAVSVRTDSLLPSNLVRQRRRNAGMARNLQFLKGFDH